MDKRVESGVQLFSRISQPACSLHDLNPQLFPNGGPASNEVLEVEGDFANDLLVDFLIRCVLPTDLNNNWRGSKAVFIDTSQHICILKITKVIDSHLKALKVKHRKEIVEEALSRLTIFSCYTSEQLELTLLSLDRTIKESTVLLIIDDIGAQYWSSRHYNAKLSVDYHGKTNLQLIQNATKSLSLVLVFSRHQRTKKLHDPIADYRVISETKDGQHHFCVLNDVKKTSSKVPFTFDTFITFL